MSDSKLNTGEIISLLENRGFKGSVVSINRIRELESYIGNLRSRGLVDELFFEERLENFDFDISEVMTDAKSIIIATTIQPIFKVGFYYQGTLHQLIVPPTYSTYTDILAYRLLANKVEAEGYALKGIQLPEKPLLAMSGLGKYGRNNIVYVDGMGSFHRPVTFITNAVLDETSWYKMEIHKKCDNCKACINSCPTRAITEDKFMIKAEKCLTYHNEGSRQIPGWINSEWHNSVIGCMLCQNICPINKEFSGNVDNDVVFSERETSKILNDTSTADLSRSTIDKLKQIGLYEDYSVLGRNLSILINGAS